LSLNMTDDFSNKRIEAIFDRAEELNADQITFRKLYESENNSKQNEWIKEHKCVDHKLSKIDSYVKANGKMLEILPFGAVKYSLDGMGVCIDDDCMSEEVKSTLKYLILRPNTKLYSRWDLKSSLIF